MSWRTDLYDMLHGDADVSALVSDRIYPVVIPQGKPLPVISFMGSGNDPVKHKSGPSKLEYRRVQIDCYADTESEIFDLAEKVRVALDRKSRGVIDQAVYETDNDIEPDVDQTPRLSMDFTLAIKRS